MKARCQNKNRRDYKWYGGRGIKVCDEWQAFIPFREWALKAGYCEILRVEIDRIDNDGDYCPENCRFVLCEKQYRNRSDNTLITLSGITECLMKWCEIFGISHHVVCKRIKRGWRIEDALTRPPMKPGRPKK
jgi:hypothetical protein